MDKKWSGFGNIGVVGSLITCRLIIVIRSLKKKNCFSAFPDVEANIDKRVKKEISKTFSSGENGSLSFHRYEGYLSNMCASTVIFLLPLVLDPTWQPGRID